MANKEIVAKAVEQSEGLENEVKELNKEFIDIFTSIRNDYDNSTKVHKVIKQDVERYIKAILMDEAPAEIPKASTFVRRALDLAKDRHYHEILLNVLKNHDPKSLKLINNDDCVTILSVNMCRLSDEQTSDYIQKSVDIVKRASALCDQAAHISAEHLQLLQDENNLSAQAHEELKSTLAGLYKLSNEIDTIVARAQQVGHGQYYSIAGLVLPLCVNTFIGIYAGIHMLKLTFTKLIIES